jgi:large subunit ribosomal protein L30
MRDTKKAKMRIQWVRSGIGFPYRQKDAVKSLGLRWLNHIVECEDTPQNRGLIARVPHLVEVLESSPSQCVLKNAEYTVAAPRTSDLTEEHRPDAPDQPE